MTISFEGRVALVTGAGHGLGRTYALDMARRGAKVVVNDLGPDEAGFGADAAPAQKVVDEIKAAGGDAVADFGDVSKFEHGQAMVQKAIDSWGRLDAVICNAGILRDRTLLKMTEAEWDGIFAVHAKGMFNVVKNVWPIMRDQNYGRIVLTSSTSGVWGNFGQSNYGAAKTSMLGFMNVLKQEGYKYNIRINTLMPSAGTRLTAQVYDQETVDRLKPDYATPAVVYMASEACTDTGMIIAAGMGRFYRAALVRGPGLEPGMDDVKTAEWIAEHWGEITSLEGAKVMWDARMPLDDFMKAQNDN